MEDLIPEEKLLYHHNLMVMTRAALIEAQIFIIAASIAYGEDTSPLITNMINSCISSLKDYKNYK